MKKLLLNLLAVVSLTIVSGSSIWAQTTILDLTLANTTDKEFTSENGSKLTLTGNLEDQTTKCGGFGLKLDGASTKKNAKVELSTSLQAGDIISIKEFSTSNPAADKAYGIDIMDESNSITVTTLKRAESAKKDIETVSYTVTSDDALNGKTIFYIARNGSNSIYFNGITITRPASESTSDFVLTTTDTDYYTVYLDYNATIPAGVTAYTGTLNLEQTKVNVTPITGNVLPANTAVLVKTTAADSYTFAKTEEEAGEITGNDLKGVTVETPVSEVQGTEHVALTLGTVNNIIGFRKPASGKLEANKAYILAKKETSSKMSVIGIGSGEGTTGITGIIGNAENGNAQIYNIAGQRVNKSAKGLLIRNGKKFVRK